MRYLLITIILLVGCSRVDQNYKPYVPNKENVYKYIDKLLEENHALFSAIK
jgi:PBP1b-binding outer membrane lipoprotein LpoB